MALEQALLVLEQYGRTDETTVHAEAAAASFLDQISEARSQGAAELTVRAVRVFARLLSCADPREKRIVMLSTLCLLDLLKGAEGLEALYSTTCDGARHNGMESLVDLLHSRFALQKEHAAAALWQACCSKSNTLVAMRAGAARPLTALVRSGSTVALRKNAAGALWRLSCNAPCRSAIFAAGFVPCGISIVSDPAYRREDLLYFTSRVAACLWEMARLVDKESWCEPILESGGLAGT